MNNRYSFEAIEHTADIAIHVRGRDLAELFANAAYGMACQLADEHPGKITVLKRPGKMGLGTAYKDGFDLALDMGAEIIVQMDADFSHSPSYIPQMLELLDDYDVVIGSRYVPGGKLDERWSFGRYLLSWWANAVYTRLILGTKTKDTTAGFKAWKRNTLIGIDMKRVVLESPYAGNIRENVAYAKECVRDCLKRGEAPIASHLLYPQDGILDDKEPNDRELGIAAGLAWVDVCDLQVVYVDLGISPGMQAALDLAQSRRTPLEVRSIWG